MKSSLLLLVSFLTIVQLHAQNGVAISTSSGATPNASAILDVQSTRQGVLIPQMTKTQRDAISSPATSLMIYQTDNTPGFYYYNGTAWVPVTVGAINDLTDSKTDYTVGSVYLGENAGINTTVGGIWDGKYNTVLGFDAFKTTTDGHESVAIGYKALELGAHSTRNTAVGYLSLKKNNSSGNTAIGSNSMENCSSGQDNTTLGNFSLSSMTSGTNNIAIGFQAGSLLTNGSKNIAIGSGVELAKSTGSNQMNIGNIIYGTNIYEATGNLGIGGGNNTPDASAVIDIKSTTAGILIPRMTKAERDAIVSPATGLMIYQTDNSPWFYFNTGTSASPNWLPIADGGAKAINDLSDAKTGNSSVYLGSLSGLAASGNNNTGIGLGTLSLVSGNNNSVLGYGAGGLLDNGSNNILIGYQVETSVNSANNEINIGNTIYATGITTANIKVGIGSGNNAPNSTLDINGSISLNYAAGGDITLDETHYVYGTQNGATTTLPSATGIQGRVYIIKMVTAGTATVTTTGGENIDIAGTTSYSLSAQGKYVRLISNGSAWLIIGQN